jgi:hypothetical protein
LILGELNFNFRFRGIILRRIWVSGRWKDSWNRFNVFRFSLGVLISFGILGWNRRILGDGVRILAPFPLVRAILILWKKVFRNFWNRKGKKKKKNGLWIEEMMEVSIWGQKKNVGKCEREWWKWEKVTVECV